MFAVGAEGHSDWPMCGLPVEPHFLLSNDRAAPRGWAPPKHTCTLDTIGGFARVRGAAGLRERVEGADGMGRGLGPARQ